MRAPAKNGAEKGDLVKRHRNPSDGCFTDYHHGTSMPLRGAVHPITVTPDRALHQQDFFSVNGALTTPYIPIHGGICACM